MTLNVNLSFAARITSGALALAAFTFPFAASAAEKDARFELRPHCEKENQDECEQFETKDPLTKQTPVLRAGDMLDMDIILTNPSQQQIDRFRAWLAYDPTVLKGEEIDIDDRFPAVTPGEAAFSEEEGFGKMGGASEGTIDEDMVIIARVRYRVQQTPSATSVISFYDSQSGDDSHTLVMTGDGDEEENILATPLGALLIRLDAASVSASAPAATQSSASSAETSAVQSSVESTVESSVPASSQASSSVASVEPLPVASAASSAPQSALFSLLQVRNLRVTTEGTSVFLAWDALASSELKGYNVYYGTVSGQYIQRRTVDKNSTTLTLRGLPKGKTYYIAVRALNGGDQESEFSQEVGITVGNPASSTSPLASVIDQGPNGTAPGTNGTISGDTGVASSLTLLLLASAVIGTVLAFRHQMTAFAHRS